jgi:hypothetical protein
MKTPGARNLLPRRPNGRPGRPSKEELSKLGRINIVPHTYVRQKTSVDSAEERAAIIQTLNLFLAKEQNPTNQHKLLILREMGYSPKCVKEFCLDESLDHPVEAFARIVTRRSRKPA